MAWVREDIRITRTRLGEYYAIITFEVSQPPKNESDPRGKMASFDPGSKKKSEPRRHFSETRLPKPDNFPVPPKECGCTERMHCH